MRTLHNGLLISLSLAAGAFVLFLLIKCCCIALRWARLWGSGGLDMAVELMPPQITEEPDSDSDGSADDPAAAAAVGIEVLPADLPDEFRPPPGLSPDDPDFHNKFIRGGL